MDDPIIAMTVSYDGSDFHGFARQPGQRTIQGCLESALATVFRSPCEVMAAGRTDTGVHALGQVVACVPPSPDFDLSTVHRSVDGLTPPSIVVRDARWARPGFSPRFDAIRREYRYRIVAGPSAPLFLGRYAWWTRKPLDIDAMQAGASALIGEHDFRSFCVSRSSDGKSTVRRIESIQLMREDQLGEESIVVRVVGNAFLHSMVRIIVGALVDVGAGKRGPEWVGDVLAARDRTAAARSAPAQGLTLWSVEYPDDVWL